MAEGPGTDEDRTDPVDTLRRRIDSQPSLPSSAPDPAPALGPPTATVDSEASEPREPTVDVVVTPARIYVTVELPGASKDRIDVQATERSLEIRASSDSSRRFEKVLELPTPVNPEAVQATYTNGVLDITLLRKQGHVIRVKRGDRDE